MNIQENLEEIKYIQSIWLKEPHRAECALCPNCLTERLGVLARAHTSWCSIGRIFKTA